jgi:hypothetical protein
MHCKLKQVKWVIWYLQAIDNGRTLQRLGMGDVKSREEKMHQLRPGTRTGVRCPSLMRRDRVEQSFVVDHLVRDCIRGSLLD